LYVGFELFFVNIDCCSQNLWIKKCVGREEQLEGTLRHQGSGCNLSFYYLIQMHFSFLYESYLSILYDSLITYIVSYQVGFVILVFVGLCSFVDISP
jgi:prolipoprotein diacylglyceryltransferase